ncbi:MAG TPA: hypothetical protein DCS18_16380 [Alcanivorax sp.]|jgi:hypothetical protein|nr:hypothetical protein [Alcanivorax sp.]HAV68691.1 hypothetical protein [Alcanivorax sp.]|tara:strand:- start:71775 stop:72404 length:630 start_codon:yes stop_codon:yes gene_type:complete
MTEQLRDFKADLDAIEANIMAGDMSAHQVFTMMRQMVVAAGGHRITISMTEEDKERLIALSHLPGQILESPLKMALPELVSLAEEYERLSRDNHVVAEGCDREGNTGGAEVPRARGVAFGQCAEMLRGLLEVAPTWRSSRSSSKESKRDALLSSTPLTDREALELDMRLAGLSRFLGAPGDWGYGTKLGNFTLDVKRLLADLRSSEEGQ